MRSEIEGSRIYSNMINALSAASLALLYSDQASHPSSRMRLQLLLYLAQGHMLRKTKNPLFSEHIFAWDEGPVIPEVFGKYKNYGDIRLYTKRCGIP